MKYPEFKKRVLAAGWNREQLRCDVPPSPELLEFIMEVELNRYEKHVTKMLDEADANHARMAFGAQYR